MDYSMDLLDDDDDIANLIDPDEIAAAFKANKRRKVTLSPEPPTQVVQYDEQFLKNALLEHFGYSEFRDSQLEAIQAVFQKRDVAVFWATGQGKSLLYQLPALVQTDSTAIVISPLISLMQDQVAKLNIGGPVATYLGSAQIDTTVESRLHEFRLVFVTPEKLISMVDRLAKLNISLIAMDEAHCVSEWGFDFRPEFREVGEIVRSHPVLSKVPLIGLTATATPRVQADIIQSLRLRNPFVSQLSLDRSNLKIEVRRKKGIPDAMKEFVDSTATEPTIIYAPTRATVESIHQYLQSQGVSCEAYHAGLANRSTSHTNFLTGQTAVMVATTAFGMGIDKPDIRKIIHFGPPKTVEEYCQQIGRAGRDGLPASCVLYANDSDFDAYLSDFYIGKLHGKARTAVVDSLQSLRNYAACSDRCRRQDILLYFGQSVSTCGICDVCHLEKKHGSLTRDFGDISRMILFAIHSLRQPSMTNLIKVVNGGTIEHYHYNSQSGGAASVEQKMECRRKIVKGKYTQATLRELLGVLKEKGYVLTEAMSSDKNGFSKTWLVHYLSEKGRNALVEESPIMLPVPSGIREVERMKEERFQKQLDELEKCGIPQSKIPTEEIEKNDGPVFQAYRKWHTYLNILQKGEKTTNHLDELVQIIETWRSQTAVSLRLPPVSVMAEHLVVSIAYVTATSNIALGEEALLSAGVRVKEKADLAVKLHKWQEAYKSTMKEVSKSQSGSEMVLHHLFPQSKWKFAVYKAVKKTGKAAWEGSYERYNNGESPQAIAMSQASGKPIQATTVVGHVLDAMTHGCRVDNASTLAEYCSAPTKEEWELLEQAEAAAGIDVCGDPATSGKDGDRLALKDLIRPMVGDEVVEIPYADRTEEQKAELSKWYEKVKWYLALKRSSITPVFKGDE